jgi:hypothetical protein
VADRCVYEAGKLVPRYSKEKQTPHFVKFI